MTNVRHSVCGGTHKTVMKAVFGLTITILFCGCSLADDVRQILSCIEATLDDISGWLETTERNTVRLT